MKIKFRHIMLTMAVALAGCGAYFSVWGLSQLFAGASLAVIIMASILELGKLIVTTALHTYWNKLAKALKIYLTISVVILMLITSVGIYGFLSNAYQKTANKLEIHEGELGVLESKKAVFEKSVLENQKIIDSKTKRFDQLSGLRNTQEGRMDASTNNRDRNSFRNDIASANGEIQKLSAEIDVLNAKNAVLSDSIGKYNVKALEIKSGSDVAGEVGPLKFVAGLTGLPMDRIVNYLILLLVFVFDPLAIALVLATNRIFELEGVETPLEPKIEAVNEPVIEAVNDAVIEEPIEGVNEGVNEIDEGVDEEILHEEPIHEIDEVEPEVVVEPEVEVEPEPAPKSNKIQLEDIRNRQFSVPVPNPRTNNTIERIGSNKVIKDGDNNKFYFKRNQ